jgi:protein-S-isoprenylcysteine O-methyltransferase Ste14
MKKIIFAALMLLLTLSFSSCVGVGYSSRGGWFVWPGSCGLLVIILLIVFLTRRRR